jgi:polyphosphate glucokinase
MTVALGIDIGGTGIKGALVDTTTGELVSERIKRSTPGGGEPNAVASTVLEIIDTLGGIPDGSPIGICFPAIVKYGKTLSAANVSPQWIGLEAEEFFESKLGHSIAFVNDADAAGLAEARFGAAAGKSGLIILTTLGTGIGSAIILDGKLVPNTELGHLEMNGKDAEKQAAYSVKEKKKLDWRRWAARLQQYYSMIELLFTPDLLIVGGGVSKNHADFLPLLKLNTPIIPATLRNNAGIVGAALLAVDNASAESTTAKS